MTWIKKENHIAIRHDKKIAHLNAVDVYDALKKEDYYLFGENQGNIENAFPNIYFSSIGLIALPKISCINGMLSIEIKVENQFVDFVKGEIIDQIIIEDEWHYISNAKDINRLLKNTKVRQNGSITINDYFEILKENRNLNIVENIVQSNDLKNILSLSEPKNLNATLFEYQKVGYSWMTTMLKNVKGCILGDEMGLGKTLQAISLIQDNANMGKKVLVVAPVSLLENWKNECLKFAPYVKVLIHHGLRRGGSPKRFKDYDCIVTSYSNVISDNALLNMIDWELLILDEAQNIKNPYSKRSKYVKEIESKNRLAITGTPFENHILDIWSLVDFVLPGYLGTENEFNKLYQDDINGAEKIEPMLSLVMIRRLVKDVAKDLPEKVIIPQPISMTDKEIDLYESIREELSGATNYSLPMLTKLRMFCTHPNLVCDDLCRDPIINSLKYQRCCEVLEEIIANKEKVIIFTSYQKMFDIFMEDLADRFAIPIDYINGSTQVEKRQQIVDWFNSLDGSAVLILNPKAAGTGLNITAANHVIHYNLEWNPAVEDQASARAYRRGQKKTVFIHRFYYKDTVEEIVNQRIDRKREMATTAVIGSDGSSSDLQDIIDAVNASPRRKSWL
ncbi:MAG: DEAD/DEAH box helicase [Floccifex sp.]